VDDLPIYFPIHLRCASIVFLLLTLYVRDRLQYCLNLICLQKKKVGLHPLSIKCDQVGVFQPDDQANKFKVIFFLSSYLSYFTANMYLKFNSFFAIPSKNWVLVKKTDDPKICPPFSVNLGVFYLTN